MNIRTRIGRALIQIFCIAVILTPVNVTAQSRPGMVTVMHYFTGELGRKGINEIFSEFQKSSKVTVFDNPIGHENFKSTILEMARGGYQPDMFSYWAGARTQFVADMRKVRPIDGFWNSNNLDQIVLPAIANSATRYNGKRYLVPFGYHFVGIFYNTKVLRDAGFVQAPSNWDEFVALCKAVKAKGIVPIALGSKHGWPAQFWFDYLLIQTAGLKYRDRLMRGDAAYTDPEVKHAIKLWRELLQAGFFVDQANSYDWTNAADQVSRGDAAMTLMGTWITGYWNGRGFKPESDYDFFEFPVIDASRPRVALGPVDGFLFSSNSANLQQAQALAYFMISDVRAQSIWATSQGALSPNKKVDRSVYTPVMRRAQEAVNNADHFAFAYDLATPPPIATVGLKLFTQFIDEPDKLDEYLAQTEKEARRLFKGISD